jgi:hypothetical protein
VGSLTSHNSYRLPQPAKEIFFTLFLFCLENLKAETFERLAVEWRLELYRKESSVKDSSLDSNDVQFSGLLIATRGFSSVQIVNKIRTKCLPFNYKTAVQMFLDIDYFRLPRNIICSILKNFPDIVHV